MNYQAGLTARSLFIALMVFLWSVPVAQAEVLLTPELLARVGYTSNRYLSPVEEGSPYTHVSPSIGVYWFEPGGFESQRRWNVPDSAANPTKHRLPVTTVLPFPAICHESEGLHFSE